MLEVAAIVTALRYCGVVENPIVPNSGQNHGYLTAVRNQMKTRVSGIRQRFIAAMHEINGERQQNVAAAVGQNVVAAVFQAGQQVGQQQQQQQQQAAQVDPPEPTTFDDVVDFVDNVATPPQIVTLAMIIMGPGEYTFNVKYQ